MSYRAFVVCEDHTLDQFVAVPVVLAMLKQVGKPHARVRPVSNPRLQGISQVESKFAEIAERYAKISDLVVFALDRDKQDGIGGRGDRRAKFADLHSRLAAEVAAKVDVVLAVEETEVWALWGSRSQLGEGWSTVRAEQHPKERFFEPLVNKSDVRQPGGGRSRLVALSLASGWDSLAGACDELREFEERTRARA